MDFADDFNFDCEVSELQLEKPIVETTSKNENTKNKILDNLIDKYRENGVVSNLLNETKDMEEDIIRDVTAIVNKKTKITNDDKEEEKYDFKNVLSQYENITSFIDMKLSKSILKALNDVDINTPTPIQAACIPQAMMKKDICACAKTGSGKTIAFLVPIFEKLIRFPTQKGKYITTRAVILSPTRELALQTFEVATKLLKYCPKLSVQLVSGGLNRTAQEASLRNGGDIIIATPGRLIDLIHNTANFDLHKIEFLVLDEADKMLDQHFIEQIKEVLRGCSPTRQVMLFSATMTENVRSLTSLSLKDPLKIFVNENNEVADNLQEEFVRIRSARAEDREAMMMALICRSFSKRTIVFLPTKNQCHRIHVMLGLLGIRSSELHSNMSQAQRLEALGRFAKDIDDEEKLDVLVGTDLAARGLDITDVQTVINYSLPKTVDQYIHRVGRTARNLRSGKAISLIADTERTMLKKICKISPNGMKMRKMDAEVIEYYVNKVKELDGVVKEIIETEKAEKEVAIAELEIEKAQSRLESKEEDTVKRFNWFAKNDPKKKGGINIRGKRRREENGDDSEDDGDRKRPRKNDKSKPAHFSKKIVKKADKEIRSTTKVKRNLKFKKN